MVGCVQPAGVLKVGAAHSQFGGPVVHGLHEHTLAAAHKLRHRHGGIVGGGNADGLEQFLQRHLFPRLQPDLAAAHAVGMLADGHDVGELDLARLQRLKGQQQRHHLGDGGNGTALIGIFLIKHRPGILIHKDGRLAGQVKVRGGGGGDGLGMGTHHAEQCQQQAQNESHGAFFHGNAPCSESSVQGMPGRGRVCPLCFAVFLFIM